jgi:hypothetical protein
MLADTLDISISPLGIHALCAISDGDGGNHGDNISNKNKQMCESTMVDASYYALRDGCTLMEVGADRTYLTAPTWRCL